MNSHPKPLQPRTPLEVVLGPWLVATLLLVIFPGVRPTPIGDGIIPNWLFFSPSRLGWFYLLLCPVAASPAGLFAVALHYVVDRGLRGRFRMVSGVLMLTFGMVISVVWSLTIYRSDPDGKRPSARDRQSPVRASMPSHGSDQ